MAVEEKILSDEDKEQMLKESSSNKDDVEFGRIYTVNSVKIMHSDKEFFEETAKIIPDITLKRTILKKQKNLFGILTDGLILI